MNKKKVKILSTSRADFGIMEELIIKLQKIKKIDTELIVTGSHLSTDHGKTILEIREKKISKINIINSYTFNTDRISILNSLSKSFKKFPEYLKKNKADILIVLGDRYELLPFCYSAIFFRVPILHIHGGEETTEQLDNLTRKIISIISNYHFVTNIKHKKEVAKLINDKKHIYNIGSLSLSNIGDFIYKSKKELEKKYKILLNKKILLITFHPETVFYKRSMLGLKNLLNVVKKKKGFIKIFTGSNADENGLKFNKIIKKFCKNDDKSFFFKNLGRQNYFSFMKICEVVIGNSSSGIIEAPTVTKNIINIGNRQNGRLKSNRIINCGYSVEEIEHAFKYKSSKTKFQNPYYKKNSVEKACNIILKILKINRKVI